MVEVHVNGRGALRRGSGIGCSRPGTNARKLRHTNGVKGTEWPAWHADPLPAIRRRDRWN